jgi:hypothetical protein
MQVETTVSIEFALDVSCFDIGYIHVSLLNQEHTRFVKDAAMRIEVKIDVLGDKLKVFYNVVNVILFGNNSQTLFHQETNAKLDVKGNCCFLLWWLTLS